MRGAIAAGHPLTAEAGARVLAAGGNAVDACIAAGLASWVTESPLTGPGGGGFMLVHRARDGASRLLDFFAVVPGLGLDGRAGEMEEVNVLYGESAQIFKIGAASVAVPGVPAGLEAAHRAYGTLPLATLAEPALELARDGFELTPAQDFLHDILDLILRHNDDGRAMYGLQERIVTGDRFATPELASTIERLVQHGADDLYRGGELGRSVVEHVRAGGGELTERDLTEYRVIWRRPVRSPFRGTELVSNPPPSSGGLLIGLALRLLDGGPPPRPGSAEAIAALVEVMREMTRTRQGSFAAELYRGGLPARLYSEAAVAAARGRVRAPGTGLAESAAPGGTTHISVVDARGNAASLSASTGSGSGVVVPGTGIHLNNMLGEYDLAGGLPVKPGRRLTSMMAPSIALADGSPRLVVGSAGSIRLRGAILQVALNVLEHRLPVEEAISAPRVHLEHTHVHCEGGHESAELDRLEGLGYELTRWPKRNLYFGGAAAVTVSEDGELAAAGDPRRGGHGIVVD
ncbi:MAG: gamma-glutamyltransferase [Thermoleophilia bacterium]